MIDLRHPLVVLAGRLTWAQIEGALAPSFARKNRSGQVMPCDDLFGATLEIARAKLVQAAKHVGIVLREIGRKLATTTSESPGAIAHLKTLLGGAERIRKQQPKDKNKLYALHTPEVECIGKSRARKPYEFGVKASNAVTHKSGLMFGARSFPGNPYDGHILLAQLEQTRILLEDVGREPKEVLVDLGFLGVNRDNHRVGIIHRGKYKSLSI